MKKGIEHSIKESLDNFEMEYNADAWTAMKSKLDAQFPTDSGVTASEAVKESLKDFELPYNPSAWSALEGKLGSPAAAISSNRKWYWIAALVIVGTTTALLYTKTQQATTENNSTVAQNETNTSTTPENMNEDATYVNGSEDIASANKVVNDVEENESNIDPSIHSNADPLSATQEPTSNPGSSIEEPTSSVISEEDNGLNNLSSSNAENDNNSTANSDEEPSQVEASLTLPMINDVCAGEFITIDNSNNTDLVLNGPDLSILIPANEELKIRMDNSGAYQLHALSNESKEKTFFMVKDTPSADFLIDDVTKFENGLPTTKVESTSSGATYEWTAGKEKFTGRNVNAHFYTKGEHAITLVATGNNGCQSTITKSVYVEDDYNLMAVNSFRPNSNNPLTNTFMPYALTERDVQFTMVIIDPRTGQVVYKTSDASQGWNGIDQRSGRMIDFENTYIWKVTIQRKASNEKYNKYSGIVIPVESRQ